MVQCNPFPDLTHHQGCWFSTAPFKASLQWQSKARLCSANSAPSSQNLPWGSHRLIAFLRRPQQLLFRRLVRKRREINHHKVFFLLFLSYFPIAVAQGLKGTGCEAGGDWFENSCSSGFKWWTPGAEITGMHRAFSTQSSLADHWK